MAGVALGDVDLRCVAGVALAWTFVLRSKRGAYGAGLDLVGGTQLYHTHNSFTLIHNYFTTSSCTTLPHTTFVLIDPPPPPFVFPPFPVPLQLLLLIFGRN